MVCSRCGHATGAPEIDGEPGVLDTLTSAPGDRYELFKFVLYRQEDGIGIIRLTLCQSCGERLAHLVWRFIDGKLVVEYVNEARTVKDPGGVM